MSSRYISTGINAYYLTRKWHNLLRANNLLFPSCLRTKFFFSKDVVQLIALFCQNRNFRKNICDIYTCRQSEVQILAETLRESSVEWLNNFKQTF